MNEISKIGASIAKRFISNVKFPKTSHLPQNLGSGHPSESCFDPSEIKVDTDKKSKVEPTPQLNIKLINSAYSKSPKNQILPKKYHNHIKKIPNLTENQISHLTKVLGIDFN
ncbi:hypothetical protein HOG98_06500 [bacterium]|jgi:hypothetical protein|nr:hypothetical protein [bacterium]